MKIVLYISILLLGFSHFHVTAQAPNYALKAFEYYKQNDFQNAKIWIDSAVMNNEVTTDRLYFLHGLIYRELENVDGNRVKALTSLSKAKSIASSNSLQEQINKAIYNTTLKTYNEAYEFLKAGELNKSEARYLKYKEQFLQYYDPTHDFDQLDINYFNTLGSAWQQNNQFADLDDQLRQLNTAVEKFNKTLAIDPNNYDAIYSIGVAYYNLGADLIMLADPKSTIDELNKIQSTALRLFKNGEPFLLKAHEMDPNNIEVLMGLRNIYHGMQEDEKSLYYKSLIEKITGKPLKDNE
ncbi:MAG: tetratricopeptide repeat protein [Putridiphycobacter sp.]|nr:tetratricopeptide repeat protein [Putridiphycobacter sp.]